MKILRSSLQFEQDPAIPGVVEGMSFDAYRASRGMNGSALMSIAGNAEKWRFWRDKPRKPTKDQKFGVLYHTAILEPQDLAAKYAVAPDLPLSSTKGVAARLDFMLSCYVAAGFDPPAILPGQKFKDLQALCGVLEATLPVELISQDDWDTVQGMRASVMKDPDAANLVNNSKHEVTLYCKGKKGRVDILTDSVVADVKTTVTASPLGFRREIEKWKYEAKAVYYLELASAATGREYKSFIFIAVEKVPPYSVAVYELGPQWLERGWAICEQAWKRYEHCMKTDTWDAYGRGIQMLPEPWNKGE